MMCFGRRVPWVGIVLVAACVVAAAIIAGLIGWGAFPLLCLAMMVGCMVMMAGMSGHSHSNGEFSGGTTRPFGGLGGGWFRGSDESKRLGPDER